MRMMTLEKFSKFLKQQQQFVTDENLCGMKNKKRTNLKNFKIYQDMLQ